MFNDRDASVAGSPPAKGRSGRKGRERFDTIEWRMVVKAWRKGRCGRTQREIRRVACGLLGAPQVELDSQTPKCPGTPYRGRQGERVSAWPIERFGETRLLRQVCARLYLDQRVDGSTYARSPSGGSARRLHPPPSSSGCDLTANTRAPAPSARAFN